MSILIAKPGRRLKRSSPVNRAQPLRKSRSEIQLHGALNSDTVQYYHHKAPFVLENGAVLAELQIAFQTYGALNRQGDNVVWVCHALTANAEAADWWEGLVGEGKLFDPAQYYIVCANMPGSCYGSTGPASLNPATGQRYGADFPLLTIRDMVQAHRLLQAHLGIQKIRLAIGGSMGGQQVLEWAVSDTGLFEQICLLATNAFHSPWGIAFNEAQRMAIEADPTLDSGAPEAGKQGIEAARAIAMLSYRSYESYRRSQSESTTEKIDGFLASSYQRYQGLKLHRRFDARSYLTLSKAMDSHHVGRGRGGAEKALAQIKAQALVIGIESDVLFPPEEQAFLAKNIPNAYLEIIDSHYGHDGFLIEYEQIGNLVSDFIGRRFVEKPRNATIPTHASFVKKALPGTERF